MNTIFNSSTWKLLPALAVAAAMASCETVDQGKDAWNGMSNKNQNTVLGGIGGAVVGAIASGGKAGGAIIGGAAGALGGRVITDRAQNN